MTTANAKPRTTILVWLLAAMAISAGWGYWIEFHTIGDSLGDFRAIYYAARTVLDHHDPYSQSEFLQVYRQEGGAIPKAHTHERNFRQAITICVNLPSTLLVIAPFAFLPWWPAHIVWMVLLPLGLFVAGCLVWDLCMPRAPTVALCLIFLLLANCQILLELGNASGMAVILCVIGVWSFVKDRYIAIGVLCFAAGLAIKPQEIAFVWLYFVLSGGLHRRRALQTLGVTFVLVALSVAWVSGVAPHWFQEWHANVAMTTAPGNLNDPAPSSFGNSDLGMIISLQAVFSYFWDNPHFYNPASLLLGGALILFWGVVTLRSRASRQGIWLAIASISALSLLPVYHREYDPKILVLTIPAVAALWAEGSPIRKYALAVTAAGIVFTADVPLAVLSLWNKSLNLPQDHLAGRVATMLMARTPTFSLLLVGVFYLWAYVRFVWSSRTQPGEQANPELEPATASA